MDNNDQQLSELKKEVQRLAEQLNENNQKILQLEQTIAGWKMNTAHIPLSSTPSKLPANNTRPGIENFIGLRLIHLVGIIILVIGLSIGVKYAIDKNLISVMARIGLAYAAGGVLYFLSWQLKKKYALFSSILFSGAMASLYFTTYGAFVYYNIFSTGLAFLIMILLTFFTAYQAISYNKKEIALLGLVGAYAVPFLISANAGRADLFFAYIFIINIAVVYLVFKKRWKLVGQLAELITWVLFLGWSLTHAAHQQQWIGITAMILFFVLFAANALGGSLFRAEPLTVKESQQLLVNNVACYLGTLFIFNPLFAHSATASVSFVFALFAAVQTFLLHQFFPEEVYAKKMHGLLSVVLLVLFVAFEWSGIVVTLLWLVIAVALFVAGLILKNSTVRIWSILLMGITLLKLVALDSLRFSTVQKIIAYLTLGVLLLVISFFYQKFREKLFGDE